VASNWIGGAAPANNGTEFLEFNDNSDSLLFLDASASFLGIVLPDGGPGNNGTFIDITGTHSLTLGGGAIIALSENTSPGNTIVIGVPLALTANQTWLQVQNSNGGAIQVDGAITGSYSIALTGDGTVVPDGPFSLETFALTSGSSTFSGGVTLTGSGSALYIGASSSGPAGAPTSGPVGTGNLSLGDGTTLSTTSGGLVTLGNPITAGDQGNGYPITFGGGTNQFNTGQTILTLTGPVLLNDADLELDAAPNSIVTLAGNLNGYTSGVCLDFGGTGSGSSIFIVQGSISNVSRLDLEDSVSVILDASSAALGGTGTAQVATVSDIGTSGATYLGLGKGYASAGNVSGLLAWMGTNGTASNFQGTLGFDTTTGATAVFDSDTINLTGFTSGGFVGLGSATTAILGPDITILPPGANYLFGGGGGTLTVQTPLPGVETGLTLAAGNAPLTLILSGPATYTGSTNVNGAALIFDTALPSGAFNLQGGYIGSTVNSGISDSNSNIQAFVNLFNADSSGIVGFDSLTGARTVASNIDMSGLALYLGTASPDGVTFTGTITPNGQQYQFAAVKGGQMTVASDLPDVNSLATSVIVGLPGESGSSFYSQALQTGGGQSTVTLSGNNTYTGGTTLNSGYLFVAGLNPIGTGLLNVPNNGSGGWVATLAASGGPVALANDINIPQDGLALNTGSSNLLTLNGVIGNTTFVGTLGIFGPVTLSGSNTYNGSTFIQGTTVTSTNDWAFGNSQLNATASTLTFTSASPQLLYGVYLSNTVANFTNASGTPTLANLSMYQSTINFSGPSATIESFGGDSPGSGNVINLGTNTALTINQENDPTYHGVISGGGSLTVLGGGELELRGSNNYTGGTTVDANTLLIVSNNSALGTGPVNLAGGGLVTNTGVTVTNPITFTAPGGGLAGFGTFSPGGNITFQNMNGVDAGSGNLSHGNGQSSVPGPGTLTFAGGTSLTFGPLGGLIFSLADANGAAGTGYGTINVAGAGTLTITATPSQPFEIQLLTFGPSVNSVGPANNFVATSPYSWTLLSAASISGFNPSDFVFDTTNFLNPLGAGSFFVSQSGNDLMLNFTPVPEPSTWALMASGLCAVGAAVRRRRR
jgi:fibronectin-binding autotransporter adhesin